MKNIKVGICYDTSADYGMQYQDINFTDFADLVTVSEIKKSLEFFGFETQLIGNYKSLNNLILNKTFDCDIIFNIAEGYKSRNREGLIPALLEINQIKHTASDAYAMSISLNKYHTKLIAKALGINTPKDCLFTYGSSYLDYTSIKKLKLPLILKPNCEGGSMGIVIVDHYEDIEFEVKKLFEQYQEDILCEEFIDGAEVTVPLLGNENVKALGIVTVLSKTQGKVGVYDNLRKLEPDYEGDTYCTTKVKYSQETQNTLINDSIKIYKHLRLFDYSRMDFKVTNDGVPYFLEINPMPALCRNDSYEICGQDLGLNYADIIHEIVNAALKRYSESDK